MLLILLFVQRILILKRWRKGSEAIRAKIDEINAKGLDASTKEKSLLTVLELALEMTERGYSFQKIDLYKSVRLNLLLREIR